MYSSPSPSHLLPAECTALANIFTGMCFFFWEVGSVERIKQLSHYIVAYDGDIVTTVDEKTTHILCGEDAIRVCYNLTKPSHNIIVDLL